MCTAVWKPVLLVICASCSVAVAEYEAYLAMAGYN